MIHNPMSCSASPVEPLESQPFSPLPSHCGAALKQSQGSSLVARIIPRPEPEADSAVGAQELLFPCPHFPLAGGRSREVTQAVQLLPSVGTTRRMELDFQRFPAEEQDTELP